MEVVHEGILELGYNPDSKSSKDWKCRLFVLKRHPTSGRSTLDYYKNTNKRWQKQSIKGVISLWPEFEITLAHQCPYKYTLRLTTSENVLYLASNSSANMNKWFHFIQIQKIFQPVQDTFIYTVRAQDSDDMNMIGVVDECQLAFTPEFELLCVLLPSKQVVAVWPFDCLKTFSYGHGLFSFQAGRHAPRGPGDYSFITNQDHLIHNRLVKLIERARRNSSSSGSSSRFSMMDSRPPARLPIEEQESSSDSPVSSTGSNQDLTYSPHKRMENVYVQGSPTHLSPSNSMDDIRDFPPPLPDLPPPKIPPKGLSPNTSWLHERYGSSLEPNKKPVFTDPNDDDESSDHVYSHTIHKFPKQFDSPDPVNDPQIYNSLVRKDSSRGKQSEGAYDIAYPGGKNLMGGAVYDTAYNETDNKPPSPSPPPLPTNGDGMTANPMYGSQSNLLDDIINNPISDNSPISQSPPHPPKPSLDKSLSSSPDVVHPKPTLPDITANPVYITSNIRGGSPPAPTNQTTPISESTDTTSKKVSHDSSPLVKTDIPSTEKDTKGYTKIKKPTSPDHQGDSDPPPIPERQYSINDEA